MSHQLNSIWTIGHSTLPLEEFLSMLKSFDIQILADVRSFPGSRKFPQYNKENLQQSIPAHGIQYVHIEKLGGRRKVHSDSKNTAWRHPAFRGYADYMETADFKEGIKELVSLAQEKRVAYMCSEAVWWRCHRSLISDYLKINGWKVFHIMGIGKEQEHPYTGAAAIINGSLNYEAKNKPIRSK